MIGTVREPQVGVVVIATEPLLILTVKLKLTVPLADMARDDGITCICVALLEVALTVVPPTRLLTVTLIVPPAFFASEIEDGLTDMEHGVTVVPVDVLVLPVDVLVLPVEVLVLPVEVFVVPVEVLVLPVDVLVLPVEVLVVPVEVFVDPVDVLVVPVEVLLVPVEVFAEPEDVLLVSTGTLESTITSPETLLLFSEILEISSS